MNEPSEGGARPPDAVLDCTGDLCPMPIYKTSMALMKLRPGEVLEIVATDRGALRDFPAMARQQGHTLLSTAEGSPGVYTFRLQRGGGA